MGCCSAEKAPALHPVGGHPPEKSQLLKSQPVKPKPDFMLWGCLGLVSGFYSLGALLPVIAETVRVPLWVDTVTDTVRYMVHATWLGVVIGAVFAGVLSKIPREFVMSLMGPGGSVKGLVRATMAGVLLDLCNHGILIVATKLYERGLSAGQVIAFLLASPWNSFSLTFILIGLIGWQWTGVFIVLSMVIALITGWMFDRLVAAGVLPANHRAGSVPDGFDVWAEVKKGLGHHCLTGAFLKSVFISGFRESKVVVRWLLFGIVLAALLRSVMTPVHFEQLLGPTVLGLTITIAIATVLEVCSEGSAPLAADIITQAKAPGNGFAFLMAGTSTDYTEIMILKDTTRSWKFALFLPLLTVPQVVVIGWIINITGTV